MSNDEDRQSLVDAYLAALPGGLRAYPQTRCKAAIARSFAENIGVDALYRALPPEFRSRRLLELPTTAWLTEVEFSAILLAIRGRFAKSDDDFLARMRQLNRALLERPAYRVLRRLFSPTSIARAGHAAFKRMHPGLGSSAHWHGDEYRWEVTFPAHLIPPILARAYAVVPAVAIEFSGAPLPSSEVVEYEPTRFVCELRIIR